jgi:hypothetical protein
MTDIPGLIERLRDYADPPPYDEFESADALIFEAADALSRLSEDKKRLEEALEESILQIEYLHGKFSETGTGTAVIASARSALKGEGT